VTTVEIAEGILRRGDADLVGMVRAHIADPRLLPKSRAGKASTVRPCVGASVCVNALLEHRSLRCLVNPEIGRDLDRLQTQLGEGRLAAVIGAGPAGLEAARRLALRGYSVQLYEREAAVGGQVRRWANTPSRREFFKALDWWRAELDRLRVEL